MAELADRAFPLSRLHSSGQRLKAQAGLQLTSVTEEKADGGLFLNAWDYSCCSYHIFLFNYTERQIWRWLKLIFGHQAKAKRGPVKSQLPVSLTQGQSYISCFQQDLQSMNDWESVHHTPQRMTQILTSTAIFYNTTQGSLEASWWNTQLMSLETLCWIPLKQQRAIIFKHEIHHQP